jgi:hypothetical protein
MDNEFFLLNSFDSPVEANIVKGRLEAENIYCFLAGEHLVGMLPYYSNLAGGIRLFVKKEDYVRCLEILSEDLKEYKKTISCKVCGSENVHYVTTLKKVRNWFSFIISMLFTLPMGYIKVYKCDNCGSEINMAD